MPFQSAKQRKLFWAARNNPSVRKKMGISLAAAKKMTEHDEGGKLPARVPHKNRELKKMMRGR